MTTFQIAEAALINLPVGSVVSVGAAIGWTVFHYQHQVSGIVEISPGAYCRLIEQAKAGN